MKNTSQKTSHYYAVIFTSHLSNDTTDYSVASDKMEELAKQQPGFLGVESARDHSGLGITISYGNHLRQLKIGNRTHYIKKRNKEVVSNGMKTFTYVSALLSKNLSFIGVHCNYEEKISSRYCS